MSSEPPASPNIFSKSNTILRPRLLAPRHPCRTPPIGLPRASVTSVKVGVTPWSSSDVRAPYQSPSRCSLGRTSWKGVSVRVRVPAGGREASSAWTAAAQPRTTRSATATRLRLMATSTDRSRACPRLARRRSSGRWLNRCSQACGDAVDRERDDLSVTFRLGTVGIRHSGEYCRGRGRPERRIREASAPRNRDPECSATTNDEHVLFEHPHAIGGVHVSVTCGSSSEIREPGPKQPLKDGKNHRGRDTEHEHSIGCFQRP